MDSIMETPLKRSKTGEGHMSLGKGYNSADDSGDDLFDEYNTVATIPLPALPQSRTQPQNSTLASYPIERNTQSSQLLDTVPCSPPHHSNYSSIQVAASSSPAPKVTPARGTGGILSMTLAPPGTTYRHPTIASAKAPPKQDIIEVSDDEEEVRYFGGSSEDDTQRDRRDIKPSTLSDRRINNLHKPPPETSVNKNDTKGPERFSRIIASSSYNQGSNKPTSDSVDHSRVGNPTKRKAGPTSLASAYGDSNSRKKVRIQTTPSKATTIKNNEMTLEDIEDFTIRKSAERTKIMFPQYDIYMIFTKLLKHHGSEQDAQAALADMEEPVPDADLPIENHIDLTQDEDEVTNQSPSLPEPKRQGAKQQLKGPARSLHSKYTSTQRPSVSEVPEKAAPKRKLVRGRKNQSSPQKPSSPVAAPVRESSPASDKDDSGVATSGSEDATDFDGNLLQFFNTCSIANLSDLASITDNMSQLVISKRPFKNLDQVRRISEEATEQNKPGKKASRRRPLGEKIVDKSEKMWAGYEAVDALVKQCQKVSQPVAQAMEKWGIDVYGSKNGELDVVTLASDSGVSAHDSGIGTPKSLSGEDEPLTKPQVKTKMFPQPAIMPQTVQLKDYQVVGVNWLSLLYNNNLSCILADDMGLGKTCQVIAFLAHLFEQGEEGPHLIIVPSSVIENWLREFQRFCPALSTFVYHGLQKEREEMQDDIAMSPPNVIVTTYTIAKQQNDMRFLRKLRPVICVYDEGHALKNQSSNAFAQLMKIRCQFRLLLTGTPLQNNLGELTALLRFILPEVFADHEEDLKAIFAHKATTENHTHEALLSEQRVDKAKSMLTPFILRRKKHQVLKHLPAKTKRVEYCEMTEWQHHVYKSEWDRYQRAMSGRARGDKDAEKHYNVQMALRKAAIHPMLHRYRFDDAKCRKMVTAYMKDPSASADFNPELVFLDLTCEDSDFLVNKKSTEYATLKKFALPGEPWMDSGKVEKLISLVLEYKTNGDRALIFSQMTSVMDIVEMALDTVGVKFCRIDGTTKVDERQSLIDMFYEDESITCFMLSTRAGGAGLNLAAANKVIIFDAGYNPQDDIQAENRAHRVGQTRDVEVVRLITKGSIEEAIHALGETKLALDEKVAATDTDQATVTKVDKQVAEEVEKMLLKQMQGDE